MHSKFDTLGEQLMAEQKKLYNDKTQLRQETQKFKDDVASDIRDMETRVEAQQTDVDGRVDRQLRTTEGHVAQISRGVQTLSPVISAIYYISVFALFEPGKQSVNYCEYFDFVALRRDRLRDKFASGINKRNKPKCRSRILRRNLHNLPHYKNWFSILSFMCKL